MHTIPWALTFVLVAVVYTLIMSWYEQKLDARTEEMVRKNSTSDAEYIAIKPSYERKKRWRVWMVRLLVTLVILTAISYSSVSIEESSYRLGLAFLLMVAFYAKTLLRSKGLFAFAHLSNNAQSRIFQSRVQLQVQVDSVVKASQHRRFVHGPLSLLELEKQQIRQVPGTTALLATHREALAMSIAIGVAAMLLPCAWVAYLSILWGVQLVSRVVVEVRLARRDYAEDLQGLESNKLLRHVWPSYVVLVLLWPLVALIPTPTYTMPQSSFHRALSSEVPAPADSGEVVVPVKPVLPPDITGMYFLSRADGVAATGATARISREADGKYYMQVYSDNPTRRFSLTWDEDRGILHSDVIGDGCVKYDSKYQSTEINFSDIWVLTN